MSIVDKIIEAEEELIDDFDQCSYCSAYCANLVFNDHLDNLLCENCNDEINDQHNQLATDGELTH